MSVHAELAALGCAALAVALIACALVVWLIFATRTARDNAHRHERRTRNQGPPAGEPERRHRTPEDGRARRSAVDDPQWRIENVNGPDEVRPEDPYVIQTDRPQDVRRDDPATYPPRPAARHRSPDDEVPATVEHAPPTADVRALPPPGSIPR